MQVEERLRREIDIRTEDHGHRAALSRAIGQKRGWMTDYVTRKVKHIKVDELAQLAPLIGLDVVRELTALPAAVPLAIARQLVRIATAWPQVVLNKRVILLSLIEAAAEEGLHESDQQFAAAAESAIAETRRRRAKGSVG